MNPEKAQLSAALVQVHRELIGAVDLLGTRLDFILSEFASNVPDQFLFFREKV
jgi:hypothetical protein